MGFNKKPFLLLCLLAAIVLLLSSDVAARIVNEFNTHEKNADKAASETKEVNNDAKFFKGYGAVGGDIGFGFPYRGFPFHGYGGGFPFNGYGGGFPFGGGYGSGFPYRGGPFGGRGFGVFPGQGP